MAVRKYKNIWLVECGTQQLHTTLNVYVDDELRHKLGKAQYSKFKDEWTVHDYMRETYRFFGTTRGMLNYVNSLTKLWHNRDKNVDKALRDLNKHAPVVEKR